MLNNSVIAYFKALLQNMPGRIDENHKGLFAVSLRCEPGTF
jgi:hypothetical protein